MMIRTVRFIGLLAISLVVAFTACKKDKPKVKEVDEREAVVSELCGVYSGKQVRIEPATRDTDVLNLPIKISRHSQSGTAVKFAFNDDYRADLTIEKVDDDNVYLGFLEGKEVKTRTKYGSLIRAYYQKGESKFSGYIGVYDRKDRVLQLALKSHVILELSDGTPMKEVDYVLNHTGWKRN